MSFKKFKADVSKAAQRAAGDGIPGVISVANGDSDGEVVIKYRHESLAEDVCIQALAQDISEYPDGNMFMLWTDDDEPPPPVVAAIKAAQDYLLGLTVYEMVVQLSGRLEKEIDRVVDGGTESLSDADEANEEEEDADDDYDAAYDEDYPSDGDQFGLPSSARRQTHQTSGLNGPQIALLVHRIRRDLRQVKLAGYKVGFLDSFGKTAASGMVSISIRVDKLGLSDEAMEAWDVSPTEYVVLLLRTGRQYNPLERVMEQAAVSTEVEFRIGKCNKFKPLPSQAAHAFAESNRPLDTKDASPEGGDSTHGDTRFEKLFISNSLDSFMCESFISLLKIREARGLDWEKANEFLLSRIGLFTEDRLLSDPVPGTEESDQTPQVLDSAPERIGGPDHLLEKGTTNERSLPLVAMEFAMRYFVRCTEYCLRCHRRLEKGFEALRPYVCSDPLCLFQYMAMGFGPSIEHEILTEPYVVDLLVSLCYAAIQPSTVGQARTGLPIRSLPVGLRLRVPDLCNITANPLKARISADNTRLVFESEGTKVVGERVAPTKWLAFCKPNHSLTHHARVQEVDAATNTATIEVMTESPAYWGSGHHKHGPGNAPMDLPIKEAPEVDIVDVFLYDTDFDSLEDDVNKGLAMRHVLDTLPPILEIEEWLTSHPHSSLRTMERISPAAASLLQWIVSSNRSCIFQVDRARVVTRQRQWGPAVVSGIAGRGRNREHERILGMNGWVQFRFAQGSPDKELRFNRALQEVAARKQIHSNPTIFAWHGSQLCNWHSIVRTGLDFKDINSGRAYGNGVYFSPSHQTSLGYAGRGQSWKNSNLDISTCLSLNEIINAPDEFVSRQPHYVVAQPDWHQCRYLFVQTAITTTEATDLVGQATDTQAFHSQAPGLQVYGQSNQVLQIPLSAIPPRTTSPAAAVPLRCAKRAVQLLEDSDGEDAEDIDALFMDDESDVDDGPPNKKPSRGSSIELGGDGGPPTPASISIDRTLTDFEPGSLDLSTLLRLAPPSFATNTGTKSLSHELKRLQSIQSKTPLHELGWYMDFDDISNLYQWIVQLHSFDPALPLAKDMKTAGVTSVVLELRFGPDYPYSPPFVRVVRPRFLPFIEGGGGHVTAGGAMCMELLTSSGWSPVSSMESVFLQVRMAMCNPEPRPARLHPNVTAGKGKWGDYGVNEAIDAYVRAATTHGWTVPSNLHVTARGV
jgi:ubiquitin-conjugating enzyme E2 Q